GLALAESIRESGEVSRSMPIILFGDAWDRDSVVKECNRLRIQCYLPKPISIARLVEAVEASTEQSSKEPPEIRIDEAMIQTLNTDHLSQITGGDAKLQTELGELFLATATQYLDDMRLALADNKEGTTIWRKAAHALKGASVNLGATTVAELAREAENNAPEENAILTLEIQIAEVRSALVHAGQSAN
ncbi:MAG: Hpt domain-containing protein, partial [Pseudomonadota bacterium]